MMALAGVAYSCMVVSSFSRAQTRVLEMGFADDINTYVMISGNVIMHRELSDCAILPKGGRASLTPVQ